MDLPADLRAAIEDALGAIPVGELTPAVDRLIARYRTADGARGHGDAAILARPVDVLAYAAYRMPATYAAVRAALSQAVPLLPGPRRLLDLGGGTGAATWAATDVFPDLAELTVLDQVPAALDLGRRLAAARPALRPVRWEEWTYRADGGEVSPADLVMISYLLGELPEPARGPLIAAAARSAPAIVVVEPGTPAGYGRVLAARDALLAAGLRIVAPCPHEELCPLATSFGSRRGVGSNDWCHFAIRLNRSAMHRRAKGAILGYEDEKFSYVAAVRSLAPGAVAPARVLRRPVYGRGLVRLRLCLPSGAATDEIISRRQGGRYRAARDLAWGEDWWPQASQDPIVREDPED